MTAGIELETGLLGRLAAIPGYNFPPPGAVRWSDTHPDTGAQVSGTQVPHWDAVRREVLRVMTTMHGCHCIGWDVVVTAGGFEIIEGNNRPDVHQLQVHGPLLVDDRVRRVLAVPATGR
jgi:hypothetical protein